MSRVTRTHTGIIEWNGDYWCDSCGRRVKGITIVNGMDFCAKCYQETFGETEKDRKITDLQSKLEEAELEAVRWEEHFNQAKLDYNCLKEELAEKERQVKKLNLEAQKYFEDAYCNDFHNQDKISFAIAELEKVKNIIKNKVEIIDKRLDNLNIKIVCESTSMQLDTYEEISKEIDNQIASLKKGEE